MPGSQHNLQPLSHWAHMRTTSGPSLHSAATIILYYITTQFEPDTKVGGNMKEIVCPDLKSGLRDTRQMTVVEVPERNGPPDDGLGCATS